MAVRAGLTALLLALLLAPAAGAQMPGGAPQAPAGALHRYYSGSTNTHWVTPTPVSGDFATETTCGRVAEDRPAIGGLLLWKDEANFLRLDRGALGEDSGPPVSSVGQSPSR